MHGSTGEASLGWRRRVGAASTALRPPSGFESKSGWRGIQQVSTERLQFPGNMEDQSDASASKSTRTAGKLASEFTNGEHHGSGDARKAVDAETADTAKTEVTHASSVMPSEEEGNGSSPVHEGSQSSEDIPAESIAERTSKPGVGEGNQHLTVIDGPMAIQKVDPGLAPLCPARSTGDDRSYSSMSASSGELLGESAISLERTNAKPTSTKPSHEVDNGTGKGGLLTEQDSASTAETDKTERVASSKSAPDMGSISSDERVGLETIQSISEGGAEKGRSRSRSPMPRPPSQKGPRERTRTNSFSTTEKLIENLNLPEASPDDDDDEEEYEIPPHIQSKIVEKSPAERYIRFKEKLGSGAYKDVYRAYDTIEGIEVAWNVVKLGGVPKAERQRIVNEVRLLERLHHPNIISFHGSWVNRETERVIFVTEILSSGTLKSFVQKVQLIRWKIFKRWAKQILRGLEYLHSQDPPIIHRDLKCDNIFINGTSGDLRIGDFGLSTAINKKNQVSDTWCR